MPNPAAFSTAVLRQVAEDKLRNAIEQGEFENLPGLGRPAAIIDEPYYPLWWIGRKLKRENLVPRHKPAG